MATLFFWRDGGWGLFQNVFETEAPRAAIRFVVQTQLLQDDLCPLLHDGLGIPQLIKQGEPVRSPHVKKVREAKLSGP